MPTDSRFEFISLVGEEGMGAVYKVFDHEAQKTCALKVSKYPEDENEFDKTISEGS